ncbi:MAG: LytTR family transcriptional regulator DNA-binding domain-containing protein [Chitinophagales bacterium]|nr:LytTR family transcriptional regulator DNA-binding domain-containing protein [Chitinophagales bacterium]
MTPLKVGIIEDDLLIAESIYIALQQIGYIPIRPVRNYSDALTMIAKEKPDFLLVDIILEGEKDGVDLANEINKYFAIPFIFLTANSDAGTVNRAKQVNPFAYLVKPFTENDLYSSIEIAVSNFNSQKKVQPETTPIFNDTLFVKEAEVYRKIATDDILYIESNNVYLHLHTADKSYLVREKLEDFIAKLSAKDFVRVHRSYAINFNQLDAIHGLSVIVKGKEIPLGRNYRNDLLQRTMLFK